MLKGENAPHRQENTDAQSGKRKVGVRRYDGKVVTYYEDGTYTVRLEAGAGDCAGTPTSSTNPNANNSPNQQEQDTKAQ